MTIRMGSLAEERSLHRRIISPVDLNSSRSDILSATLSCGTDLEMLCRREPGLAPFLPAQSPSRQ